MIRHFRSRVEKKSRNWKSHFSDASASYLVAIVWTEIYIYFHWYVSNSPRVDNGILFSTIQFHYRTSYQHHHFENCRPIQTSHTILPYSFVSEKSNRGCKKGNKRRFSLRFSSMRNDIKASIFLVIFCNISFSHIYSYVSHVILECVGMLVYDCNVTKLRYTRSAPRPQVNQPKSITWIVNEVIRKV